MARDSIALPQDAVVLLGTQIERAEQLKGLRRGNPMLQPWIDQTERALAEIFGDHSQEFQQFHRIYYGATVAFTGTPDSELQSEYIELLAQAQATLRSLWKTL